MKRTLILTTLILAASFAYGQGTFQYDQGVNPTSATSVFANIQPDPTGQSFIPALSSVDFVQLYLSDPNRNQDPALYVDLWAGSLGNGTLLGQSSAVSLSTTFTGVTTFLFPTTITVTPGTTYYLQPVVQSGDSEQVGIDIGPYYANGMAFFSGTAEPSSDLWFREGIVVPEPSYASLVLLGLAAIYPLLRRRTQNQRIHQKEPCSEEQPSPHCCSR